MANKSLLSLVIICFLFSGCDPLMYPHQMANMEGVMLHKKIAIMPCNLFYENQYSKIERNKRMVIDSIQTKAQRMGFDVIDQDIVNRDVDSIMSTFKSFYNPKTGELDTVLTADFRKSVIQHFTATYHTSAVLFPYLRISKVYIAGGYSWDGRLIKSFLLSNARGTTTGLSLYVRIFDSNNNRVFDNAGGIQVLSEYTLSTGGFRGVPISQILSNPEDLRLAVEIVFKPIQEKISGKN